MIGRYEHLSVYSCSLGAEPGQDVAPPGGVTPNVRGERAPC